MHFRQWKRRDFITLLGGAAAWPLAAHAQQADRLPRIGVLIGRSERDPEGQEWSAALERGLKELGWTPGQTALIDYRWQTSDLGQRTVFVNEIIARRPDILVASTTQYLAAARNATQTIPIVFVAVADPVAQGFVASLAQPGGMITGFGLEEPGMGAKWVELLMEIAPGIRALTAIFDPDTSPSRMFLPSVEASIKSRGAELVVSPVRKESEIESTIAEAAGRPSSGLLVLPDTLLQSRRELVVAAVAKRRLPAIYTIPPFAKSGGLIAYGINRYDLFYRAATYVDRILKGATPGSLPVQMPTKFEMVINLKTAKALGLTVPDTVLARADEVIE
jgi:putative tryptophan/tyrosine transport system substrate-binding protein